MKAKNIGLNDKHHPVLPLGHWPEEESVRGVAGGAVLKLVGAVVLRLTMFQKGTSSGPEIKTRFKITQKGAVDWVGMTMGAHAIDHPARGGRGHTPSASGHWMETLKIRLGA